MAKKFNFKEFLINHGEKVGVGVAGLLAFWAFASATWSVPDLEKIPLPSELEVSADQITAQIEVNAWPEEEQEKFAQTPDVVKLASAIGRDVLEREKYAHPVVWNEPPNGFRAKRKQVVVLAPFAPEASAVTVAIALAPKDEEEDDEDSEDEEKTEEEMTEEEKELERIRKSFGPGEDLNLAGATTGFGGIESMMGMGGAGGLPAGLLDSIGLGGAMGMGMGMGMDAGGGAGRGGRRRGKGDDEDVAGGIASLMGMGGMSGLEGMMPGGLAGLAGQMGLAGSAADLLPTSSREVEWRAGVSVRLIVDMRKQRQEITKALHVKGVYETGQFIDYQQMHVERQELRNGVWGDEWDKVEIDDLGEILEESLGIDVDPVSPAVTRAEITMPLPRRGTGQWLESEVSHTRVHEFTLTAEERDMMNKMNGIIAQRATEAEARERERPVRKERKGFDQYTADVGSMSNMALNSFFGGDMDAMSDDMYSVLGGAMGDENGNLSDRQKLFVDEQLEQINPDDATAIDRLLLVRFIDFTAERGKTYRYRVRLEMRNPNFGMPVDSLEQPEYATTDTIVSDWSEITAAVEVPMAYHIYVANVDQKRRQAKLPTYMESDGALPVIDSLDVHIGMPIGGSRKQERVDLEKQVLDAGNVEYKTSEVLCAGVHIKRPVDSDHPDLAEQLQGLPRRTKPVGDLICVVDHTGDLVLRAEGDRADDERYDRLVVEEINKAYESWRGGGEADLLNRLGADGDLADLLGASMDGMGMGAGSILGELGF